MHKNLFKWIIFELFFLSEHITPSANLFTPAHDSIQHDNNNNLQPPALSGSLNQPVITASLPVPVSPLAGIQNYGQPVNRTGSSPLNMFAQQQQDKMRDINRYQNHIGFNVNEQDYKPQPAQSNLDAIQRKSAVPYQLPNGPSALYSEFEQASVQRPQARGFPALNSQWGSPLQNNKFDFSRPGTRKDQIASIGKKSVSQLDPRWFGWTQGLAQTQGASKTNTHSNSLQKNDPGTVETNTHVTSTQNSEGQTDVKQMYGGGLPSSPFVSNFQGYPPDPQQQQQQQQQQAQRAAAFTRNFGPQQQNQRSTNAFGGGYQPQLKISNFLKQQQQQQQQAQKRKQIMQMNQLNQLLQQQRAASQARQINTVTHNHQWGYGNGNGNGHGTGSQGASGSGGGWGTGGPLSQNVNLPGWGGNPPDGPPKDPKSNVQQQQQQRNNMMANKLYNIATHPLPAKTMALWNAYIQAVAQSDSATSAQARQSVSDAHADTTNEAASGVVINPTNGNNVAASNHQWGFGNGNGIAHGNGKGGGDAHGGGWGAGGPTHQTTRIAQPNGRRSFINPWLSNNNNVNNNVNNFNNDFFGENQANFHQQQQQFDRRNSFSQPQQRNAINGIPPSNFNNIFRGDPFDNPQSQQQQRNSIGGLHPSNFNNLLSGDPFDVPQQQQQRQQALNERKSLLPPQQQQQQQQQLNPFMSYIQQNLPKLVDFTPRTQIPGRQVADPTMNSYLRKKHKKRRRKKRR